MFCVEHSNLELFFTKFKNANHSLLLLTWHMALTTYKRRRKRIQPPPTNNKQRQVLILELNGVLLKTIEMQHGDVPPNWGAYMDTVEENANVWHYVCKDAFDFLSFSMQWFEVWIWSTNRLRRTHCILEICFSQHHQRFHVIAGQVACQKADILLGYRFVCHKNLDRVWSIFHDLDGNNTLIFDDALYNVM